MKKGFTLVELLVVLIVIGILIALILPNTLRAIERANVVEVQSNIRTLDTAGMMCFTEERSWQNGTVDCTSVGALFTNGYLDEDLTVATNAPFGEQYQFVPVPNTQQGFRATATGGNMPQTLLNWITNRINT